MHGLNGFESQMPSNTGTACIAAGRLAERVDAAVQFLCGFLLTLDTTIKARSGVCDCTRRGDLGWGLGNKQLGNRCSRAALINVLKHW